MNLNSPRASSEAAATGRAVILTSYFRHRGETALASSRLGLPGYSYDVVAKLFVPLLARWGEVVSVPLDPRRIEDAIGTARRRGLQPIHLSVLPFQDVYLTKSAPNVVFPFWEFPDVPAEAFDGNPQNNWTETANRCDLILVCGAFTAEALRRGGIRTPIQVVPVPTPTEYFRLPPWSAERITRIPCSAYVFPNPDVPAHELWDAPDPEGVDAPQPQKPSRMRAILGQLRLAYRHGLKPLIPPVLHRAARTRMRPVGPDRWHDYLHSCRHEQLELSGIVYTSIFSPADGRKNREDLLSGFVAALRDCADATLVVKLVSSDPFWIESALNYYRTTGLAHRCKVVFITDYLSDEHLCALAGASTYYLTTTHAEGCCLPLLNYLAAGRPGITPLHSAIGDYLTPEMGFVIASSPERAFWPQDKRIRFKTTWQRVVWPSVIEQLRNSYDVARRQRGVYEAMSHAARTRMTEWVDAEAIWPRLRDALETLNLRRSSSQAA